MATTSFTPSLLLNVDAEHSGKRAAGCVVLLAGFLIPLTGTILIIPDGWLIGFLAGLIVAAGAAAITDRLLRNRWPSGRTLAIQADTISLNKHGKVEESINPVQHVNAMPYHFVVKRNSRVRKGWHVVVLTLEQDETYIPVYTFASPDDFEALEQRQMFRLLERPTDETLKGAGAARRMYTAETYRGLHGAEIKLDEFTQLLTKLQEQFPHWMPKS